MASNEKYLTEVNKFVKEMESLAGSEVVVGVPATANKVHVGADKEIISLASLGAIHEYGAPKANIPQRSFLRVPLTKNVDDLFKFIEKDLKFSKIDTSIALGRLGAKGQSVVLEAFNSQGDGTWSKLKAGTIRQRKKGKGSGSDKPLIDTGQLRQAITYEVRKG